MGKAKIGIVAGDMELPRILSMFKELRDQFDFKVLMIDNLCGDFQQDLGMEVSLFENLRDMPGYMRGLEDHIYDMDLLIGLECSRLSTFQMIRSAQKYEIPTAVVVTEFHPFFYASYPNIRAIQSDVFTNTDQFWPLSQLSKKMLIAEGVNSNKIEVVEPNSIAPLAQNSEKLRLKFRKYIGVDADDKLLLVMDKLDDSSDHKAILEALKLLKVTAPYESANFKVLFVGDGPGAKELKYRCYDLRLSSSTMFIHQDPEAFRQDLYSAADFIYDPKKKRSEHHELFPLHILEATNCGVIPLLVRGTVAAEHLAEKGVLLDSDDYQGICDSLKSILCTPGKLKLLKKNLIAKNDSESSGELVSNGFLPSIDRLLASAKKNKAADDGATLLERLKSLAGESKHQDVLVGVEGLLLKSKLNAKVKSELLQLKGDACYQLADYDSGSEAYSECLKFDSENVSAYRGLGFIAIKGHSHEEAISFFKKVLAKKEDDSQALFGVGLVHRRLGLNEEAIFWLEKSFDIIHHDGGSTGGVKTALIQACLECQSLKIPIKSLSRLAEGHQEDVSIILTLGQLHIKNGEVELGNEMVQKALSMQATA